LEAKKSKKLKIGIIQEAIEAIIGKMKNIDFSEKMF
jgi:hypothetical protein